MRELNDELSGLAAYPMERFLEIVKEVGFECNLCGKCCTRDFNDHAFLLDDDAERIGYVDKAALIPAPYYEFCDQAGTFYVSGYATRPIMTVRATSCEKDGAGFMSSVLVYVGYTLTCFTGRKTRPAKSIGDRSAA